MNNNLDEDINIIKEFISCVQDEYIEAEVNGKVYKMGVIPLDIKPTKDLAKAIENVLSELETYKKIAEKLAEEVKKDVVYYDRTGIVSCELYDKCSKNTNGALCIQCIIDWARKEVEK